MSEAAESEDILTREELDALLESLGGSSEDHQTWVSSGRREGSTSGASGAIPAALERCLGSFSREQSRSMSNLFQSTIRFSLIGGREIEPAEFAEVLLPNDLFAFFELDPPGGVGFLLIGRPLLFNLLCLELGVSRGIKRFQTPSRPYTRIESRFYLRFAAGFLSQLDRAWSSLVPSKCTPKRLEGRKYLLEVAKKRMLIANFDVRGFGEVCRLRVAVPSELFAPSKSVSRSPAVQGHSSVEGSVLRMSVELRAELGSVTLPLSEIARLRVGTVLPIDASERGDLVLRIEGEPKFRAIRGSVGKRAAVQLTERL